MLSVVDLSPLGSYLLSPGYTLSTLLSNCFILIDRFLYWLEMGWPSPGGGFSIFNEELKFM